MPLIKAAVPRWARVGALASAMCATFCAAPRPAKMTCGTCHPKEAQSQPKTAMGIGIELPPAQELLKAHPKQTVEANGYTYEIERKNGLSTYTVRDGSGALT